ncbi:hypothetical protein [Pseudoalteromonas luteoviolacea]|uniref:Uncharacterized protein n=1 Tax=Pseudoalteromonas luteoviolacea H33 TaxID=1365251 RepID=A0A167APE9_9GAMM|nr:hypothetical protein [Pseudoalteromonas luteoviolacea]KZN45641.1 hypothetical protein N476_25395 [Pseudoalteromonas luteoviolacea H33]KZN69744.1 hypothetical protein N477_26165 [Pseudoalteromonas luteoviolacea H33-S]MBQ4880151.1 hypothetical protein [Pseudoalteromonas luteoviolacea]MBQ4909190.1 hypothetical protein [Pseudoalteromonas luteoviolacea]
MKLKLNKKPVKNLINIDKSLAKGLTPEVAGGCLTGCVVACRTVDKDPK